MFKSIKTSVLAGILVTTAFMAQAQKKLSEGTITFTAEYAPTAEQQAVVGMLPTESKTQFKDNLLKMSFENGPATITVIQDFVKHEGVTLIDVPVAQIQYAIKNDKAAYEKELANLAKFSDFTATGEKKTIAGYNTERYTYKDDKGGSYELWLTNDIALPAGLFGEQFKDLKGTPVKYTTFVQGVKVTQSIKSLNEDKVSAMSLDIPSGYELTTMEDIMAMQGGGE